MNRSTVFRPPYLITLACFSALVGAGCSLSGKTPGLAEIHVDLSALRERADVFALAGPQGALLNSVTTAPPANASSFSCYAVNVVGPGIGDSSTNSGSKDLNLVMGNLLSGQSYCSYRGVVTPPIFLSASGVSEATLQVPPGGTRLIQIVGVNDSTVCASGVVDDPPGSTNSGSRFFEVGRAVVSDLFSDRSVDAGLNWPSSNSAADDTLRAARSLDCGGGACVSISNFDPSSVSELTVDTTSIKYAFKVPTVPGLLLKRIQLSLRAYTYNSAGTVTVDAAIITGPIGSAMNTLTSVAQGALSIPVSASTTPFSLDLLATTGSDTFITMVAANDYWIVISSPNATNVTNFMKLMVAHQSGSSNSSVQTFSAGSWSATSSAGISHLATACTY